MRRPRLGWFRKSRFRRGNMVMSLVALTALTTLIGVEVDGGRLYVAAHRDQIVADAMTMAASQYVYDVDQATAKASTVHSLYEDQIGTSLDYSLKFYPEGADVPTSVSVTVTEEVPTFFNGLTGGTYQPVAPAGGGRVVPSALLQGAVPLGVQYDQDFDLPADGSASEEQISLKLGDSDKKQKGNTWALDFDESSGASDWKTWLCYGYTSRISVGDIIKSKTGTMTGPTEQALVTETSSRLNRAASFPYANDTYQSFRPGNPRIVILPLVDWKNAKSGSSNLEVKGFGAFWVDTYDSSTKSIKGRFVRAVTLGTWSGVSVDTSSSDAFDGGFWLANLTE
jgi:hypothetical protein